MKKRTLSLILICLTFTITAGVVRLILNTKKEIVVALPEDDKKVPVEVQSIKQQDIPHYIDLLGTIVPISKSEISSEVGGKIETIKSGIEIGSFVKKGQALAFIKDTSFKTNLEKKQALLEKFRALYEIEQVQDRDKKMQLNIALEKLALAEAEYNRKKDLFKKGIISKQELDSMQQRYEDTRANNEKARTALETSISHLNAAKADIDSARADVNRDQEAWDNTRIKAPFDGIISEKTVALGIMVSPGQKLFTIVDISYVKLLIKVPALDIVSIRAGQKTRISLEAYKDISFEGVVENIGVEGDLNNRTFPVEIKIHNTADRKLLPGMFATAKITLTTFRNAIMVSRNLIFANSGHNYIYIADSNKGIAVKRKVMTGKRSGQSYIIENGLNENDLLISSNYNMLHDGAKIKIVNHNLNTNR